MRKLYYYTLCPNSRMVLIALSEKKLDFSIEVLKFWDKKLVELNSFGRLPVLVDLNGSVTAGIYATIEYLEEVYPDNKLLGNDYNERAEARRIFQWMIEDFAAEVTTILAFEKYLKRHITFGDKQTAPSPAVLKEVKESSVKYLKQIEWFVEHRNWIAGDIFSIADIAVAANFSVVDYLGGISWNQYPIAKDWYTRVKSRPSFRKLLFDRLPGLAPAVHYADLDF